MLQIWCAQAWAAGDNEDCLKGLKAILEPETSSASSELWSYVCKVCLPRGTGCCLVAASVLIDPAAIGLLLWWCYCVESMTCEFCLAGTFQPPSKLALGYGRSTRQMSNGNQRPRITSSLLIRNDLC